MGVPCLLPSCQRTSPSRRPWAGDGAGSVGGPSPPEPSLGVSCAVPSPPPPRLPPSVRFLVLLAGRELRAWRWEPHVSDAEGSVFRDCLRCAQGHRAQREVSEAPAIGSHRQPAASGLGVSLALTRGGGRTEDRGPRPRPPVRPAALRSLDREGQRNSGRRARAPPPGRARAGAARLHPRPARGRPA